MSEPYLFLVLAATAALILILIQSWGPIVHLHLAETIRHAPDPAIDPDILHAIENHREAFWYGTVAADLINVKRYGGIKNSCHNWNMRTRLRRIGRGAALEAFIAGYVGHLAADVVAHNVYVPYHVLRFSKTLAMGHLAWEIRADNALPRPRVDLIDRLRHDRSLRSFDALLLRVIRRRALPYGVNRRIFDHLLLPPRFRDWFALMERGTLPSVIPDAGAGLPVCLAASEELMRRSLRPGGVENLLGFDPTGRPALRGLMRFRRERLAGVSGGLARRRQARALAEHRFALAPFLAGSGRPAAVASQRRSA